MKFRGNLTGKREALKCVPNDTFCLFQTIFFARRRFQIKISPFSTLIFLFPETAHDAQTYASAFCRAEPLVP